MNFFFDANISFRIVNSIVALHGDYHKCVHITEHEDFKENNVYSKENNRISGNTTKDIEWIRKLSMSNMDWKIISGDMDIIDTAHERAALIDSKLTFFVCDHNWEKTNFNDQAWKLIKLWGEIVRNANVATPTLYRFHTGKKLYVDTIKSGMRARGGRFKG